MDCRGASGASGSNSHSEALHSSAKACPSLLLVSGMGGCDSAVLVEVRGPDAKLARASAAPFHAGKEGTTALSTSGELYLYL